MEFLATCGAPFRSIVARRLAGAPCWSTERDPHEKMAELATRDGWAILQPTGADASLELLGDWCRQRRASLHAAIFSESALLLRGWD